MAGRTQLIAKAVLKMAMKKDGIAVSDDIDLEFNQFCLCWELSVEKGFATPETFIIWLELPNPQWEGHSPKKVMEMGMVHKVLYLIYKHKKIQ